MAGRRTPKDPEGRMPLKEHLLEFRNRLMIAAAAIVVGAIIGWIIYNPVQIGSWGFDGVYKQLTYPFDEYKASNPDSVVTLNFGNATSAFTTQLSLSLFTGVIISSPVWVWQIWAFILPGLTKREKRLSIGVFATALPLFLAGCFFAYQTLPKALLILFGFTPDDGKSSNIQQASDYFTFITRFILAFGLAWLLPVFLVGLCAIGVLSGKTLKKSWRVAILLIFIASAVITPTPDPFTMFLLAGPLCVLYFIALGVCLIIDKRRVEAGDEPDWSHLDDDQASPLT
ncbi:twin-arginine translocase subunit TatC [Janibacter anophelis]|uniref:twin-arginine translocase subunit TatC n=1 Tax=Janibacter anophelis TaxID=319054 RepID=UPI000B2A6D46|nr:twin-arginine translocase subunit TatC [Janibacter anophelis]